MQPEWGGALDSADTGQDRPRQIQAQVLTSECCRQKRNNKTN